MKKSQTACLREDCQKKKIENVSIKNASIGLKGGRIKLKICNFLAGFLKFIYVGTIDNVPLVSVSDLLCLLSLAATYKLELMRELVQKKLIDSLSPSNCIKYLSVALSYPLLLELKEKAIKTIVDNLSDLVGLEEWDELTKSDPSLNTEILRIYFMR